MELSDPVSFAPNPEALDMLGKIIKISQGGD